MQIEQLAINSVTIRQAGFEEALAAVAGAGFRQVEFVLPLVKTWLAEGHTIEDARQRLTTHQLRAIGGFEAAVECFAPPASQRANRDLHRRNAQLVHDLGGGTLVVGTDGPPQPSIEDLATIAASLRGLAAELDGLDVDLALEFNWGPLVKSLRSAVAVVERIDHPRVGVLFDPAHYHTTATKTEDLTAANVRWIKHVHLNDMRDKPGDLSDCNADRVLPGAGILPLPALIAALDEHGYCGWYSIEMFNADLWAMPAAEAARLSYESLLPYCD